MSTTTVITLTITLVTSSTVTKTLSAATDLPTAKEQVAQFCKNGGTYADNGLFYPTSAIVSIAIGVVTS